MVPYSDNLKMSPEDFYLEGTAHFGVLGGFAHSMIRVAADRVVAKAVKLIRRWAAWQQQHQPYEQPGLSRQL